LNYRQNLGSDTTHNIPLKGSANQADLSNEGFP